MIRVTIPEFGRIKRSEVGDATLRRLQQLDELHAKSSGEQVFDWSHITYVRALNQVGVLQVPGLSVTILPKVHPTAGREFAPGEQGQSHRNLLYMLSVAQKVPLRPRDLASQHIERLPLLEAFISLFATRLLTELRRGACHAYVYGEENRMFLRGKLLLTEHLKHNIARKDRLFVGYDEFTVDTWLNRILKAACRRLLTVTRLARNQQHLRESLLELQDVQDVHVQAQDFERAHLNRDAERFRVLLGFAKLVLMGATPAPHAGSIATFSLVFPMDQLFEAFVGRLIYRYAGQLDLEGAVHLQAASRRRWLLRSEDGHGRFRLKPDVLVDGPGGGPSLILDTKWKRLLTDAEDAKNGVNPADLYQLYAYASRYRCQRNVLLYPRVEGVTGKDYLLDGDTSGKQISVAFIDMSYDLRRQPQRLIQDLGSIIHGPASTTRGDLATALRRT